MLPIQARLSLLAARAALLSLSACSSDSAGSTSACNALVDNGAAVIATKVASSVPTAAGGTLADGTYSLTALTAYTGVGGSTGIFGPSTSVSLTISGSTMQQVGRINGQEHRYTTTIMASGTSLSTMDTCPTAKGAAHSYTATPLALRIYDSTGGLSLEQTYSKH